MNVKIKTSLTITALLAVFAVGSACVFSDRDKGTGEQAKDSLAATSETDNLLMQKGGAQGQLLHRYAYVTSYNKDTRLPNWVAWYLTKDHTYGKYKRKGLRFEEDKAVPAPRATYFDYMQSGYSRGHMCPSGDNRWSEKAQQQSFLYTNCCPQSFSLNAGEWNDLEVKCREWAKAYGKIYIVCGPVLYGNKHKTIGKNKVVVPEAFYKVVLCMTGTPKAIGFIYDNVQTSNRRNDTRTQEATDKHLAAHAHSIDEIERITGIDFFPALPDDVEKEVEARANISDWK